MVIVRLIFKGADLGPEREWPAIPRLGEHLAVHADEGEYEVVKIVWHAGNGLIANVHLEDTKS